MDNRQFLKVKIKSLAAEAQIIRHEERRSAGLRRASLCEHRRGIVRREARSALLAYGYLRGRLYPELERSNRPNRPGPDWATVERLVKKYGTGKAFEHGWYEEQSAHATGKAA